VHSVHQLMNLGVVVFVRTRIDKLIDLRISEVGAWVVKGAAKVFERGVGAGGGHICLFRIENKY
jgi:hypothetical protein